MNKIELTIRQLMADIFNQPIDKITVESSQDNVDNWDSLKHLDLIVALEEEFEISIPIEEVGHLTSFKIIAVVVKDLLK